MKYIILIGDGMADAPIESLGGKTPLESADTPNMDRLAGAGRFGLFRTVPGGFSPGSDVANLSVLGYSPAKYYSGRAPLEAASIGVKLGPSDIAFRCNLVTLIEKDGSTVMGDYSAGHISTEEARDMVLDLDSALSREGVRFYPGTGYRHLMVWSGGSKDLKTVPPHDISDKAIGPHLPKGEGAEKLINLMNLSQDVLKNHPVNAKRVAEGKKPATSIWLWGQGSAPAMPTLKERFGVNGAIISAVDLMKGIGIYAGLEVIKVEGATGYIDTNYKGKADAALKALETRDFICVHIEAPDEAGHNGNLGHKLQAIEDFDSKIVGPVMEGARRLGPFAVMVLPDHPTPIALKTHTSDPVPFVLFRDGDEGSPVKFSEKNAAATGLVIEDCGALAQDFYGRAEKKALS
ncbi:MAG: cofactor-independent phosphoglycerate mutase [Deltaproteobacteria bacterium]|nr:cofactor-independent phosphoglycerate mutase [Deltaproteobacteria bacterium]MBZ0219868.1 cofactor-independent phosphoglycerate mutase [Deltaproteobacteria bacterium]